LETLAVVESMRRFRIYLLGTSFTVVTDCNAVRSTLAKRDLIPRIARWWLLTQEFDFNVVYRPGKRMTHVDALSRNSIQGKGICVEDEPYVLHLGLNEDDWILAAQLRDETCERLHKILTQQPVDNEGKRIHEKYVLQQNRVYKATPSGRRWVVPKAARAQVVFYHHDNLGHLGAEKTCEMIKSKYWFPRMGKYVRRYVSCCLACMYNKEPTGKRPGFLHPIPKFDVPLHTLHVDHLGPFVLSTRKNAYLIVAIDGFTKFAFLKAVRNTKVGPVLKFLDEIFNMFGVVRRIICDRGSCFTSKHFVRYCATLNIKVNHNATATPRANGQAERYNRTILDSLATSTDDERRWGIGIKEIQWGLNTSVNKTTGKTPYELLMGYRPLQANDSFLSFEVCDSPYDESLSVTREQVGQRIRGKQVQQKARYDLHRRPTPVNNVGQQVLVRRVIPTNDGRSRKLLQKYSGPYLIKKVLDWDRFVISDLQGTTRSQRPYDGVVSLDKLKPYNMVPESDVDTSSESDE
jgi:transposase InsO family protein